MLFAPDDISVRTFIVWNLIYNQSIWVDFLFVKKLKTILWKRRCLKTEFNAKKGVVENNSNILLFIYIYWNYQLINLVCHIFLALRILYLWHLFL